MTGATVCSGIGAPEVALPELDWVFCAEREKFASAVLGTRFPGTPNLGNILKPDFVARAKEPGKVDVLVAGTPCQAFSVAGRRESLADRRGNLTLQFVEICDAIEPAVVVWENVPGVLSTRDNAFGCFLGAMAGHDTPLEPVPYAKRSRWWREERKPARWRLNALTGRWDVVRWDEWRQCRWPDSGLVDGPKRRLAWRILDAQYFGLAQRRERVFVVGCALDGPDPGEILLEWEGVQRDHPPRRETGAPVTALTSNGVGTCGADDNQAQGGHLIATEAFGGGNCSGPIDIATAQTHHGMRQDFDTETFVVDLRQGSIDEEGPAMTLQAGGMGEDRGLCIHAIPHVAQSRGDITHPLRSDGHDASEDGTGRGTPLVPVTTFQQTGQGWFNQSDCGATLRTPNGSGALEANLVAMPELADPISTHEQNTYTHEGANNFRLRNVVPVAFSCKDHGADAGEIAPTLRSMTHDESHANGGGQVAVALPILEAGARTGPSSNDDPRAGMGIGQEGDPMFTLQTKHQHAVAFTERTRSDGRRLETQEELAYALTNPGSGGRTHSRQVMSQMRVRRLMPVECERLQGFPDGWTDIEYRGKRAKDGPRYRALGNAMAVPVLRWIGLRVIRSLCRQK